MSRVADFSLGQPSLDEVFLALTGHPAEDRPRRTHRRTKRSPHERDTDDAPPEPRPALGDAALRSALVAGERPPRPGALSTCLTFGWRGMLKIKHVPEQLIDVTLTPVLFLLMFTYLFGGAVAGSTGEYLQFLLPGMLVQTVLFTRVYSGVALNTDMTKGVVDRFRSLPIWRPAPLVGAVVGDCVRYLIAATVVVVLGADHGLRRRRPGILGVLAAIALVVAVRVRPVVGVHDGRPGDARAQRGHEHRLHGAVPADLPVSNIFVEPETLPGWLEAFVDVNPIRTSRPPSRGLMAGTASAGEIVLVLASRPR